MRKLHFLTPAFWAAFALSAAAADATYSWFPWRGPFQNGRSPEKYAKNDFKTEPLWKIDLAGQGAPIVVDGRVYLFGYRGEVGNLKEVFACVDGTTGKTIWEHTFRDFLSDNIYDRYAIGSPGYDPETKRLYLMTTTGVLMSFDLEGKLLWENSLMEEVGRLTFPNGRTGSPAVDGEIVIINSISANWGASGPAANRFYAFDKRTGDFVWASQPGLRPVDGSYTTPYFETRWNTRVFYAGTGDGNICCINARTGEPLWRFQLSKNGVNASSVVDGNLLFGIHNDENVDTSDSGRFIALKLPDAIPPKQADPTKTDATPLPPTAEAWRFPIGAWSSSPVVVDGKVYQMTSTGNLYAFETQTGKELWHLKLSEANLHSSPVYANGLLYVPFKGGATGPGGSYEAPLFVVDAKKGEVVTSVKLDGEGEGAPAIAGGKLYINTRKKTYAFQIGSGAITLDTIPAVVLPKPGPPAGLQMVPGEVLLEPGSEAKFTVYKIDAHGERLGTTTDVKWEKYIPATAKVKAMADAQFNEQGALVAAPTAKVSAGAYKATTPDGLSGTIRARVSAKPPINEDFESFAVAEDHPTETGVKFAYPPLPWLGARFKWEIRELEGNKVLAKTLDQMFFQRATTFIGPPDMSNYTVQADLMTDGNRRMKSEIGLVNQRYLIAIKGNDNALEITSNFERLRVTAPFPVKANQWYTLKTRVDLDAEGTATVRAKAWEKGGSEPEAWMIEAKQADGHKKGSPGVFGFSPQAQKRVFIDNITVTPNAASK
jgi:outer membrane protein assembly factor BamB